MDKYEHQHDSNQATDPKYYSGCSIDIGHSFFIAAKKIGKIYSIPFIKRYELFAAT
jgi:hypothetical protein